MKKRVISISVVVLILIILIFSLLMLKSHKLNSYSEITYDEFNLKRENKENFPLVIGSSTCSACAMYKPVMESFIKEYQIEVFYIDISKISEEEYNKLKTEISFSGTPTTVFYENGTLTSFYNRIDGAASIDSIISGFKQNNYIK